MTPCARLRAVFEMQRETVAVLNDRSVARNSTSGDADFMLPVMEDRHWGIALVAGSALWGLVRLVGATREFSAMVLFPVSFYLAVAVLDWVRSRRSPRESDHYDFGSKADKLMVVIFVGLALTVHATNSFEAVALVGALAVAAHLVFRFSWVSEPVSAASMRGSSRTKSAPELDPSRPPVASAPDPVPPPVPAPLPAPRLCPLSAVPAMAAPASISQEPLSIGFDDLLAYKRDNPNVEILIGNVTVEPSTPEEEARSKAFRARARASRLASEAKKP